MMTRLCSPNKFQAAATPTDTLVSRPYCRSGVSHVVRLPRFANRYPLQPAVAIAGTGNGNPKDAEAVCAGGGEGGAGRRRVNTCVKNAESGGVVA